MALLDSETGTIVVRVIYDGPSASGKTTSLRTLTEQLPRHRRGEFSSLDNRAGHTLYFDYLDFEGGMVEGYKLHCQIATTPGAPMLQKRRFVLLGLADVVIFVTGTNRSELNAGVRDFATLSPFLEPPGEPPIGLLLQANKRDHDNALPLAEVKSRFGNELPIVETVAAQGLKVKEAFILAVKLAVDRAREMITAQTILGGPPEIDGSDALVNLMDELAPPYSAALEGQSARETTDLKVRPAEDESGSQLKNPSDFETQKISADHVRAVRAMQR